MKRKINKQQSPAQLPVTEKKDKSSRFNFSWRAILYITLFILLGLVVGFLSVFIAPLLFRQKEIQTQDPLKILTQDLNEGTLSYPIHVENAIQSINYCDVQALTHSKINRLLNNARITVHFNCADESSEHIQQIVKQYFGGLKVTQKHYSKFTAKQIMKVLKRDFVFAMQNAHPVAQRLMSIFFTSERPRISIYTDSPEAMYTKELGYQVTGRYLIANNTVRLMTKAAPSMIVTHETAHAGAIITTYGNTLWPRGEFSYPITSENINHLMSNAFPCDQQGFYEIWEQEVDQVLAQATALDNPKFLDIVQEYAPQFFVWISEKTLANNADSLLINTTITLTSLPKGTKFLIHPELSQYEYSFLPNTFTHSESYYQSILLQNPVTIGDTNRDTEFPGIAAIRVSPLTMEPKVKAAYLIQKFGSLKNYANRYKSQNGHCQEAFAVTFELNSKVINKALPKSIAYLEKRLDEYEHRQCPGNNL